MKRPFFVLYFPAVLAVHREDFIDDYVEPSLRITNPIVVFGKV